MNLQTNIRLPHLKTSYVFEKTIQFYQIYKRQMLAKSTFNIFNQMHAIVLLF